MYEIDVPASILARNGSRRAKCDRRMEIARRVLGVRLGGRAGARVSFEFVPPNEARSSGSKGAAHDGGAPKRVARKGRTILYYKELDTITALLTSMGAFGAVLHLEDVRAMKETKNRIHRLVNTEAANVERAASAAALQRDAIVFSPTRTGCAISPPRCARRPRCGLRTPKRRWPSWGAAAIRRSASRR